MKFLVDMPVSVHTAAWLRRQGHNAVHLHDEGLQRLPDDQIVRKARAEGRAIITMDLGFGHLLAFAESRTPSVILFRLHNAHPDHLQQLLAEYLPLLEANLRHGIIAVIEDHNVRVHRLPIRRQSH